MWIKDTGWEDLEKGYINVTVGGMKKEEAKKWVALRHHIFLGDTIDGGVWEFEDKLPKYVLFEACVIVGTIYGATKGNGKRIEWLREEKPCVQNYVSLPRIASQCNTDHQQSQTPGRNPIIPISMLHAPLRANEYETKNAHNSKAKNVSIAPKSTFSIFFS